MAATTAARITNTALRSTLGRSAFSTTGRCRAAGAGPGKNGNKKREDIEIPAFDIKHITSSPRGRRWLIAGFCVLASIEGYGWYNFGSRMLGWEKGEK